MAMTIMRHRREHPDRPMVLVVGGISTMWGQGLRARDDLFVFWLSPSGKTIPRRLIPARVGFVIFSRATNHSTTNNVKITARKASATLYPGIHDTRPIE